MYVLTIGGNTIVLGLIVLVALVLVWQEVLSAKRMAAVLALERQEVDEVAVRCRALLPDGEQLIVALGSGCRFAGHGGGSSS